MSGSTTRTYARIKVQLYLDDDIALGPGKRELLDHIDEHRSISAAARAMGLSYRRAWLLVDTMNRCFRAPVVSTDRGGSHGGGAALTPFGKTILERFRTLEAALDAAARRELDYLRRQLRPGGTAPSRVLGGQSAAPKRKRD